jgi:hypothetical protein
MSRYLAVIGESGMQILEKVSTTTQPAKDTRTLMVDANGRSHNMETYKMARENVTVIRPKNKKMIFIQRWPIVIHIESDGTTHLKGLERGRLDVPKTVGQKTPDLFGINASHQPILITGRPGTLTIFVMPFIAYHAPSLTGCSRLRHHICVTAIKAGAILVPVNASTLLQRFRTMPYQRQLQKRLGTSDRRVGRESFSQRS